MFGVKFEICYPFLAAMVQKRLCIWRNVDHCYKYKSTRYWCQGDFQDSYLSKLKDYPMVFLLMGVTIVVTFIFTFIFRKVSVLNKLEPELALADIQVLLIQRQQ